nr:cytochrome P450 71A2-like [Ipomoea trifida]
MVQKIKQSCGSAVNLSNIFIEFTNDIVCRVTLGRKCSDELGRNGRRGIKSLLEDVFELVGMFDIGDYIPWLAWVNRINGFDRRVEKLGKELDEFMEEVVEEHSLVEKQEADGLDLVDILLQLQRENTIGFPIHRDSVKALILDMFAAGTHTTYTVIEWTMTELIKNPRVMEKLKTEDAFRSKTIAKQQRIMFHRDFLAVNIIYYND